LNTQQNPGKCSLQWLDPATTDCRIKLSGSYQDFESTEVFRLIGKIIYEWIYFREGFDEPVNSLTSLSNFVTQGTGQINIKLIWDPSFYEKLVVPIPLGNHCLALFINKKEIYCCISLFGFVAYLIDIGSQEKIQIPDAFLFDYLDNTSGKVLPLKYPNEASFNENYEKAMTNNCIEKGGTVCYSNELTTTMNAARQLPAFINNIVWEDVSPEKKNRLLGSRLEEFRSYAFVNPHQLKRFCEEKKEDTKNGIVLDSRADNSDEIFLLFLVFRIGQGAKEKIDPLEISDLIDASCQKDNGGNPVLGPNDIDAMKKTIMETPNKEMIIERGMEIIQKS
jgi:hypothetical protein